jgi:hypothetical protein
MEDNDLSEHARSSTLSLFFIIDHMIETHDREYGLQHTSLSARAKP